MIPKLLTIRNFMCYKSAAQPLDFTGLPVACLSGENGAGKSSILDALTWALWGEARLKSDDDLIALGETEMEVQLIFALDGQEYQAIRRRSKARKTGVSELYFNVRSGETWRALTGATLRETQDLIVQTLRMSYEVFSNSGFLRQGHADEFTRRKPAERKAVLAEILGLGEYEALETRAKERARGLDGQVRGAEGMIEAYEREARQRETRLNLVTAAELRLGAAQDQLAAAELALAAVTEELRRLEGLRPLRAQQAAETERLRQERARLLAEIAERDAAIGADQTLLSQREAVLAGAQALRMALAAVERLEGLRGEYDVLAEQARGHNAAITQAEAELRAALREQEAEARGLRERDAQRPQLRQRIARLEQDLDGGRPTGPELEQARARRTQLQEQIGALHRHELDRSAAQARVESARQKLELTRDERRRQLREAAERIKASERLRAEREKVATERERLLRDQERLTQLRAEAQTALAEHSRLQAERDAIKSQGDSINRKLELLTDDTDACPLCENPLDQQGVTRIRDSYTADRQTLRADFAVAGKAAQQHEQTHKRISAEIVAVQSGVDTLADVAGRLARLDGDLAAIEELRQRHAELQRELSAIELQLVSNDFEREARADLARAEAALKALGDSAALARETEKLDARVRQLEQLIAAQANARTDLAVARRELQAIEHEAPALFDLEQRGQELRAALEQGQFAPDSRAALAAVDMALHALGYSREAYDAARLEVRRLSHWQEEEQQLALAEQRLAKELQTQRRAQELLAARDAALKTLEAELARLDQELRGLPDARQASGTAQQQRSDAQRTLGVVQRDLAEQHASLRQAEDAVANLLEAQARRTELIQRKGLFDELAVAFGKKGIQAMLIETAIPEIEQEANALLGHMTDSQMNVRFETQGATKKGDVTETLDIKIADGLGTRDYDAYSGGESFRVDFAIRIALAKLLARRAGARLETLVIDEGFGSQDAKGRERLVEAITGIQRDFRQILVVTHIQELKDMFPAFIEVTKTPAGSVWAVG